VVDLEDTLDTAVAPQRNPEPDTDTSSLGHRQPLTTKVLGKSLRIFRLGEAEHHKVAVITAQRVRERRRRQHTGSAKHHLTLLEATHGMRK
jgi:hypothetical protein